MELNCNRSIVSGEVCLTTSYVITKEKNLEKIYDSGPQVKYPKKMEDQYQWDVVKSLTSEAM